MSTDAATGRRLAGPALADRRFVVGWRDDSSDPKIWVIGVLAYVESGYRFTYVRDAANIPGFRPLLEFPDFDRAYESDELFPFFTQRVMDSGRPDYGAYLEALALPPEATALDVLGRSGGRRKADNVQLIEVPNVGRDGQTEFDFLVHGVRFSPAGESAVNDALSSLSAGDRLGLLPEPTNPVNDKALLVTTDSGVALGWVPDLLLAYVSGVMASVDWRLSVVRVSGPDVASQLRLVVRIQGRLGDGLRPFEGEWQTA